MKKFTAILSLALVVCLLAGCAGSPVVYYSDCTCPADAHVQVPVTEAPVTSEGAVKTGLALITGAEAGTKDENNTVTFDVTLVAVLVDDNGVIQDCVIDSLGVTLTYDNTGAIVTDLIAPVFTKNELGDSYGMKAYGGAKYEWYEQAKALAEFAVGKTVEELCAGAVNESGKAADADLASTATIYLGGYVNAIEKAVSNARHLGAQAGDTLKLATLNSLADSTGVVDGELGNAQLNVDVAAVTMNEMTITSCVIDSLQAKVPFHAGGVEGMPAEFPTKNELGEAYGMKAWGGATYEWNEQAANFSAYITGKTLGEVQGIAIDETTKPTDVDLAASVTISIGGFLTLLSKAAAQ